MKTDKRYRPRVQRAFLRWYELNRHRFPAELQLLERTDRILKLTLPGLCSLITFDLIRSGTYFEINPTVMIDDDNFDLLIWQDVSVQKIESGYICQLCQEDNRKLYKTREHMWTEHLFEPLLLWINKSLMSAHWLIIDKGEYWCSARLNKESDEKYSSILLWKQINT